LELQSGAYPEEAVLYQRVVALTAKWNPRWRSK